MNAPLRFDTATPATLSQRLLSAIKRWVASLLRHECPYGDPSCSNERLCEKCQDARAW